MPFSIVCLEDIPAAAGTLALRPSKNLLTGETALQRKYGTLTTMEIDLLTLASSIFACDLAFKRGDREEITRNISLSVPVVNLAAFESVLDDIIYALFRLSHDAWTITFVQKPGVPEPSHRWQATARGKVLLFSGGLDSFAAALQFGNSGEIVHLISHVTANQTVSGAQEILSEYLNKRFPKQFQRTAIRVGGRTTTNFPFPSDSDREDTQRTRSFLFLSLAGITARRIGISDVVVIAENGQLAIHVPLTAARISAFSTHTAHPEFIDLMGKILNRLLRYPIEITNPFLYYTKGEVVKDAVTHHSKIVPSAVSCWKASRVSGKNHCGSCIPCLVRRIGIESNGSKIDEYKRDLLNERILKLSHDDEGKRNLVELAEFVKVFKAEKSKAALLDIYPELNSEYIDLEKAINMYRRFADEAVNVFDNYPNVKVLLN